MEATLVGADVIEVLDAQYNASRALLDRTPTGSSFSKPKQAVGASEASSTFTVDWRGGASSAVPDFNLLLQACGLLEQNVVNLTFNVSALLRDVRAGDVLQGATSGARAICFQNAAIGASTIDAVVVTPDVAFAAGEQVDNLTGGTTNEGSLDATTPTPTVAGPKAYIPISESRLQMTLTGAWAGSGTPSAGDGVTITNATTSQVVAGGIFVGQSGNDLTINLTWGTPVADGLLTGSNGGTAVIASSPAFDQVWWPTVTALHNRHNLRQALVGALATFGFSAEAGDAFQASFELQGRKGSHTDAAFLTGVVRNPKVPPRLQRTGNAIVEIGQIELPCVSFEFTLNNDLTRMRSGNAAEGDYRTEGVDRSPTVAMTIHQVPNDSFDYDARWAAGTTQRINLKANGGTDNSFQLVAPRAQIAEVTDGDDSGLATKALTFNLTPELDQEEFAIRFGTLV